MASKSSNLNDEGLLSSSLITVVGHMCCSIQLHLPHLTGFTQLPLSCLRSYFTQTSLMSQTYMLTMHVTFKYTVLLFSTLYLSFLLCPQLLFPCSTSSSCSLLFSTCSLSCPSLFLLVLLLAIPLCLPVDINAQARKLQRNRAKGTLTLPRSSNSSFCRSLSETSLNQVGASRGDA